MPPADTDASANADPGAGHARQSGAIPRRSVECVVALILMGLSGLALWDSYGRGAGWDGGPQSGFFPARVGWLALAASVAVFVSALRRPPEVFATWAQLRQVARVLLPLVVYVGAIATLGIYVSSALFMAFFMLTTGTIRWHWVALASLLIPLILFWVFEIRFSVLLPKGPLEAWFGY